MMETDFCDILKRHKSSTDDLYEAILKRLDMPQAPASQESNQPPIQYCQDGTSKDLMLMQELHKKNDKLQEEMNELRQQIKSMKDENERQKDNMEDEMKKPYQHNDCIMDEIKKLCQENCAMKDEIEELRGDNFSMRDEIEELRGDNFSMRDEIKELRGDNVSMRDEIKELRGDNFSMRDEIEELRGDNFSMRDEIEELREDNVSMRDETKELGLRKSNKKEEIKQCYHKKEFEKLRQQNNNLKEEIQELRCQIDNMRNELPAPSSSSVSTPVSMTDVPSNVEERFCKLEACVTDIRELITNSALQDTSTDIMDQLKEQRTLIDSLTTDNKNRDSKISHELRQQLNFLMGSVQKLEKATKQQTSKKALPEERTTYGSLPDQNQNQIQELFKRIKKLEEKKADKYDTEIDLEGKVNCQQFDIVTEKLNTLFHELLTRVTCHEQDWHKIIEKISNEMDSKLDRIELDTVFKKQLEIHWKDIQEKLRAQEPPELNDAAGLKKHLVDRFHCLSCNRPVVKYICRPKHHNSEVANSGSRKEEPQTSNTVRASQPSVGRTCGGSHTVTTAMQRRRNLTKMNHQTRLAMERGKINPKPPLLPPIANPPLPSHNPEETKLTKQQLHLPPIPTKSQN